MKWVATYNPVQVVAGSPAEKYLSHKLNLTVIEPQPQETEEGISAQTLGTLVPGFGANSHECAAASRKVLRNNQLQQLCKVANAVAGSNKPVSTKFSVLVLFPGEGEIKAIGNNLRFEVREGDVTHFKKKKLVVAGYRDQCYGNDEVRGRKVQVPPDDFKADAVVANDCLYYITPEKLRVIVEQWAKPGAPIYAIAKPLTGRPYSYFEESYELPDSLHDSKGRPYVEARGVIQDTAEGPLVEYHASENDGFYPHPPLGVYATHNVYPMENCSLLIHTERVCPYQVLYKMLFIGEKRPESRATMKRNTTMLVDGGVCVKVLPQCVIAAGRVNNCLAQSMESYYRTVSFAVVDSLRRYDFTDTRLQKIVKTTGERAWAIAGLSRPKLPAVGFSYARVAENNMALGMIEDGIPTPVSKVLAIAAQPARSKVEVGVQLIRAAGVVCKSIQEGTWLGKLFTRKAKAKVEPEPEPTTAVSQPPTPEHEGGEVDSGDKGKDEIDPLSLTRALERFITAKIPGMKLARRLVKKLDAGTRSKFLGMATKVSAWIHEHPQGAAVADGVLTLTEAFVTALWEEAVKRAAGSNLIAVGVAIASLFGLVESILFGLTGEGLVEHPVGKAGQLLASALFRVVAHVLLVLIPYPVAVVIHTAYNFITSISRGSSMGRMLGVFKEALLEQALEDAYEDEVPSGMGELQDARTLDVVDALGNPVDVAPFIKALYDGDVVSSGRFAAIQTDLTKTLVKPVNSLLSLSTVATKRLEVAVPQPKPQFWPKAIELFEEWDQVEKWAFQPAGFEETCLYIWDRPWPRPFKLFRLSQYIAAHYGSLNMKEKEIFVKSDELLKVKRYCQDAEGGLSENFYAKFRPIIPMRQRNIQLLSLMISLKKVCGEPLDLSYQDGDSRVSWKLLYVAKPSPAVLSRALDQLSEVHILSLIHGDDMITFLKNSDGALKAVAIDLKSCDLTCGADYQSFFSACMSRLAHRDGLLEQWLASRETGLEDTATFKDRVLRAFGLAAEIKPDFPSTETGDPLTALLAAFAWIGLFRSTQVKLERYAADGFGTGADFITFWLAAIKVSFEESGFIAEFETYRGMEVMPFEAATFLAGTFAKTDETVEFTNMHTTDYVWIPLAFPKAFLAPKKVFGKTEKEDVAGWFRVCLKGQLGMLPIRDGLEAMLDTTFEGLALDAQERWERYLVRTKDYRIEEKLAPQPYLLGWAMWEDQLLTITRKVQGGEQYEGEITSLMAEFQEWKTRPPSFPVRVSLSCAALFVARFGQGPEWSDRGE
jgi:hypothetical protein